MRTFLLILIVAFSLFFVLYVLDQIEKPLHIEWLVLIIWLVFITILKKILFRKNKTSNNSEDEDEDEEEEEEYDEEDEEDDEEF